MLPFWRCSLRVWGWTRCCLVNMFVAVLKHCNVECGIFFYYECDGVFNINEQFNLVCYKWFSCFVTMNVMDFFTMNKQVNLMLSNVRAHKILMLVHGSACYHFLLSMKNNALTWLSHCWHHFKQLKSAVLECIQGHNNVVLYATKRARTIYEAKF